MYSIPDSASLGLLPNAVTCIVHSNIDIDIRANRDEWNMSRQIYTDIRYEDYHRSSKLVAFLPLSR